MALAAVISAAFAASSWTTPAIGAGAAAKAEIDIHELPLGARDVPINIRLVNTSLRRNINFVFVPNPGDWTLAGCRRGPEGWSSTRTRLRCVYRNVSGAPLRPGDAHAFRIIASAPEGIADARYSWSVATGSSPNTSVYDMVWAAPGPEGLEGYLRSWEVARIAVTREVARSGAPCPAGIGAGRGATKNIVVCGRNRTTRSLQPFFGYSSLAGSFFEPPTTPLQHQFIHTYDAIPPSGCCSAPVVLGNWAGAVITGEHGRDFDVLASIGSSYRRRSALHRLTGYRTVNALPEVQPDEFNFSYPYAYQENGQPRTLDPSLTVMDTNHATMHSASVWIADGFEVGDVLTFTAPPGLVGTYDAEVGRLSISGAAATSDYQAALQSVQFVHEGHDPVTEKRVAFQVSDGVDVGPVTTYRLPIAVHDDVAHITTTPEPLAYREDDGAVPIDPGLTLVDPDMPTPIAGARVEVAALAGSYRLGFGSYPGITATFDSTSKTLTLTGDVSVAGYEAALRAVTFEHPGQNFYTLTGAFVVSVWGPNDHPRTSGSRGIQLSRVNDAPSVTPAEAEPVTHVEDGPATPFATDVVVVDVDHSQLEGGATVRLVDDVCCEDHVTFDTTGTFIRTSRVGNGHYVLEGPGSPSSYQRVLRSMTYRTYDNSVRDGDTRVFEITVTDGETASAPIRRSVSITATNDAPEIAVRWSATHRAGTPVTLDGGMYVVDDDSDLAGLTVRFSEGFVPGEDVLAVGDAPGIIESYDPATGTLTLSGVASPAVYEALVRTITFDHTPSDAPSSDERTVVFTAVDEAGAESSTEPPWWTWDRGGGVLTIWLVDPLES